tara:strand:+ start:663 stop:1673 length:1011 start_codon:yes stop_codon:yes gene_type:complete
MKKLFTEPSYKKRNIARSSKALRNYRKRKNKKFEPHRSIGGTYKSKKERKPVQNIEAPKEFSLINNTEEVLEYFKRARYFLQQGYPIRFDISGVSTLTPDAIALQIARIKDRHFHKNSGIMGNSPNDPELRNLFDQSGFYNHVNSNGFKPEIKDILIHKVTKNKVEPKLAKEACLVGLKHTFQSEEIFDPMFDILIEIMQNTNNHAGEIRGEYDWWLHIFNDPETNISKYTFLDLGVGIFDSIPAKSFKNKIGKTLGLTHNVNLVKPLFNGEIKSRTARPERGRGIPQVYESSQDEKFGKFIMISNDVYVDMRTLKTQKLTNNFSGTLFYWELKKK